MKTFMNWSGGKDSALSLFLAMQQDIKVDALLTSVNTATNRISMHGVRRELLQQQAAAIGLPLHTIELPEMPGMQVYEEAVRAKHNELKAAGYTHAMFGDVFLEDLKTYRENLLAKDDLQCLFPIWKMDGREVVRQFIEAGFKAVVVCVNSTYLDKSFCGRLLDEAFLNDLPTGVDACGENGEYHTFVFDGPLFSSPVNFAKGETVFKAYPAPATAAADECFTTPKREAGFYFLDLLPQ
ncbi:MAG TPA: diphthine--ammonia ligase [Flavisolibacter sp.]|nr:diphthine--ammonia ligase [Flavisolibacter sp.]